MNKVDGYGVYQSQYYDTTQKNGRNAMKVQGARADKTGDVQKNESVQLSDKAKDLLKELQQKYGDMDFFVGNYSSDAEAQSYLSRGTKAFSVLMDPETLEAMAADESTKSEYMSQIDSARTSIEDMRGKLEESGNEVTRVGMTFDKDGKVSYFAEVEKIGQKYKEHVEKGIEKKREDKAESARKEERARKEDASGKVKRTMVYADSTDELLKKVKEIDWTKVAEEKAKTNGAFFDFSI